MSILASFEFSPTQLTARPRDDDPVDVTGNRTARDRDWNEKNTYPQVVEVVSGGPLADGYRVDEYFRGALQYRLVSGSPVATLIVRSNQLELRPRFVPHYEPGSQSDVVGITVGVPRFLGRRGVSFTTANGSLDHLLFVPRSSHDLRRLRLVLKHHGYPVTDYD